MADDVATPAPPPPDFVVEFFRTADVAQWQSAFSYEAARYLLVGIPVFVVVALVLWLRGVTFSRLALLCYCAPALLGLFCFVAEFHHLGSRLGLYHGYIYEFGPFFTQAFTRLCVAFLVSLLLFVIAVLLYAARRIRAHARPSLAVA